MSLLDCAARSRLPRFPTNHLASSDAFHPLVLASLKSINGHVSFGTGTKCKSLLDVNQVMLFLMRIKYAASPKYIID